MVDETKEWPEWTDRFGQVYKPGDAVVYAAVWGSSARLVEGIVTKINKVDSKGQPHEIKEHDDGDLWLKSQRDAALQNLRSVPWNDPNRKQASDDYELANQSWQFTRQPIVTPTATVAIREKNAPLAKASTVRNLHNIIKAP